MFKRFYAALGRLVHWFFTPVFPLVTRGKPRVRCLVLAGNEVLLVRSWLGYQKWSLPGGGINRGEHPAHAAAREVKEETGVLVSEQAVKPLGTFANDDSSDAFTVDCQMAQIEKQEPHIVWQRRHEVLEAAWFPLNALPAEMSKNVTAALHLQQRWRS